MINPTIHSVKKTTMTVSIITERVAGIMTAIQNLTFFLPLAFNIQAPTSSRNYYD
jgi:hypothetical protein